METSSIIALFVLAIVFAAYAAHRWYKRQHTVPDTTFALTAAQAVRDAMGRAYGNETKPKAQLDYPQHDANGEVTYQVGRDVYCMLDPNKRDLLLAYAIVDQKVDPDPFDPVLYISSWEMIEMKVKTGQPTSDQMLSLVGFFCETKQERLPDIFNIVSSVERRQRFMDNVMEIYRQANAW